MMLSIANTADNFLQFIVTFIVFVLIIVAAYFVTRWVGTIGQKQYGNKNIQVIEGCRIGSNKMIQIVKVGNKFFVLGIGKDEISCLGEVKEEDLTITENKVNPLPEFNEILAKAKKKVIAKRIKK